MNNRTGPHELNALAKQLSDLHGVPFNILIDKAQPKPYTLAQIEFNTDVVTETPVYPIGSAFGGATGLELAAYITGAIDFINRTTRLKSVRTIKF